MEASRSDLTRTTLAVLFIGMLILAASWVLRPFFGATIWATMIVVATWPVLLWLQVRMWGRRSLAVLVMTVLLLLLLFVPLGLAIGTVVQNADQIVDWAKALANFRMPVPPDWVRNLPFVGSKAALAWEQAAAAGVEGFAARLAPYAGGVTKWLAGEVGSVGALLVQFLLTVVVAALMYSQGEVAATAVKRFGNRLGGKRGVEVVVLAGQAIRGVALGVGVTAIVQSVLGGIGLAIAGVPFAGLLTAVMLLFCIAQLGPTLVLAPAVVWVYWSGDTGWGTFLLIWTAIVGTLDNFLRPILIKRGADLPLLLIFAGVIGGLLAFGLIGIFVGPVVLAVAYTLVSSWIDDGDRLDA